MTLIPDRRTRRVFMLGATGTIGRATVHALSERGHDVVCFVRPPSRAKHRTTPAFTGLPGVTVREGDVRDPASIARDGFRGERFDAVVS